IGAENSIACRSSGIWRRIRSISGRKPRSSISSASSSTSTDRPPSCRCPCWARSRSRPGAPPAHGGPPAPPPDLRLVGPPAVDAHHRHLSVVVGGQILGGGGQVTVD